MSDQRPGIDDEAEATDDLEVPAGDADAVTGGAPVRDNSEDEARPDGGTWAG